MSALFCKKKRFCFRFFSLVFSFCKKKVTFNENIIFTDYASRIQLPGSYKLSINWNNNDDVTSFWQNHIANFFWHCLVSLANFVTAPSFMLISSLVLELWQFSFIRKWPEILKPEIHPSAFRPISGEWRKLGISNLTQMSLIRCYWMFQNSWVTPFTVSELIREKQQWKILSTPSPRLGLIDNFWSQMG